MNGNYVATGKDGGYLTVAAAGDAVDLTVTEPGTYARATVKFPAWKLADLVAAMYRRAGLPVPVLVDPDEVADGWVKLDRTGGAS